jgi:hypothetical protein
MKEKCNLCKDITNTQLTHMEVDKVLDFVCDTYYQANCSEKELICEPREELEKMLFKERVRL